TADATSSRALHDALPIWAVIAFEIDRDLAAALQATAPPTLTVIASDFLEPNEYLGLEAHQVPRVVRAAGNLPYYVASPILFKLRSEEHTSELQSPDHLVC